MPQYQLGGWLPKELEAFDQLEQLVLSNNQLKDTLPPELGKLKKLQYLELQNNSFTGLIPVEWTSLVSLRDLQLNDNQLIGRIPFEFTALSNLTQFIVHNNTLEGEMIPSRVNDSYYRFAPQRPRQATTQIPSDGQGNIFTYWGALPSIVVAVSFFAFLAIFVGLYLRRRRGASVTPQDSEVKYPVHDLESVGAESCNSMETLPRTDSHLPMGDAASERSEPL
jgi:Leucine-rich repeat (LRR) protein